MGFGAHQRNREGQSVSSGLPPVAMPSSSCVNFVHLEEGANNTMASSS